MSYSKSSAFGGGASQETFILDFDETPNGHFTGGSLKFTRIGDQVVVSSPAALTHDNVALPQGDAGSVPLNFRPPSNQYNGVFADGPGSQVDTTFGILADGGFRTFYHSLTSRTDTFVALTCSYNMF